jgi:hypothetical protein
MKIHLSTLPLALLLSFIFVCSESFSQSVSPNHLFNTGLNMGFLSGHVKMQTGKENYGVWAGNASAEWIESWESGSVNPIIPDITIPSVAHNKIISAIMNMGTCFNPYFQTRLGMYKAGYYLGEALVQSGTSCTDCLQLELQRSAIELRTISSLIKNPLYSELSENLNSLAASLKNNLSADLATQQNQSQFTPINTIITTIQTDLPIGLQQCEKKSSPEPEVTVAPVSAENNKKADSPKEPKEKKRVMVLKVGMNSGYLKGDGGTKTNGEVGWLVGFDFYRGKNVFFHSAVKFWRNATGEELMIPLPSQQIDEENFYVQGFTFGLGLGGYVVKKEKTKVSLSGKLNYLISHSINGNLSSVGVTKINDGAFHIELGGQVFFKPLFLELSYEFGLSEALTSGFEKYKYNMINLSAGVYF